MSKTSLRDFLWLEGKWKGEAFGGRGEEIWSAPEGNCILGMYRLIIDDKTNVIEFLIIEEKDEVISLRFKHFNTSYETRENEAPLYFVFKERMNGKFIFQNPGEGNPRKMIYSLTENGEMQVRVESMSGEKSTFFETFKKRA